MGRPISMKNRVGLLLVIAISLLACNNSPIMSKYNPNELVLLLATSNHGEVGPCG